MNANATTPVHHSPNYPANKGAAPEPKHSKQFPENVGAPPMLHHSENWEQHKGEAPHRGVGQYPPFVHKKDADADPASPLGIYILFGAIVVVWATIPTFAALAFFG